MMDKQDLRVIKTHKVIRNALIELLAEYEFDKISVEQILQRAMVNRNTFYKYYSGKSDLAGVLIGEFKTKHQALIHQRLTSDDLTAFFDEALPFMNENRELILALWKIKTKRHHLYDDMFFMIKHAFITLATQKHGQKDWDYQGEMFAHLAMRSVKYQLEKGKLLPLSQELPKWYEMLKVVES